MVAYKHSVDSSCVLGSGLDLPYRAVKTNIADSLNVVIHLERRPGRYIPEVLEINSYDPDTKLFDYSAIYVNQHDIRPGKGMTYEPQSTASGVSATRSS
jgi:hypothetical protein